MSHSNPKGFSLLELLICMSIIALLLSLSLPSFQHALNRSYAIDAKSLLLEAATRLNHYYTEHQTYAGATLTNLGIPEWTEQRTFHLELSTTAKNYELKAIGPGKLIYKVDPTGLR